MQNLKLVECEENIMAAINSSAGPNRSASEILHMLEDKRANGLTLFEGAALRFLRLSAALDEARAKQDTVEDGASPKGLAAEREYETLLDRYGRLEEVMYSCEVYDFADLLLKLEVIRLTPSYHDDAFEWTHEETAALQICRSLMPLLNTKAHQ
ncbi:hypothetical protein [Salaquimonas pukyongi]|uniref:hypothetical protein n=1 Tax=Salaquimonas pukyongi TaxID=2712698 RepID=UPI00096B7E9C|nr:hypothetical protein [Salaquimonas pukyongi]